MLVHHINALSSSGRILDFDSSDGGSNPPEAAKEGPVAQLGEQLPFKQ